MPKLIKTNENDIIWDLNTMKPEGKKVVIRKTISAMTIGSDLS